VVATEDRRPGSNGMLHYDAQTSGAWAHILRVQVSKSQVPTSGYEQL
jgi:hypothetical protein